MEMPKIYVNPPRSEWPALTARCTRQEEEIGERVAAILAEVRTGGDAALRRIVRRIEGYLPETFEVTRERRAEAAKAVSPQLKAALEQANTALAARFSPRLVQEASEIFAALTGGRYARVQVDRRMNLEAGEQDAVMHRLLSLSGGTADGLYLAVRLAICRLLLPASAPIVLDDALAMLDDTRLRLALQLLQQEAASRQILLFTCQSREAQALEN